jgi:D-sedoheptulose 7-phosphate isomerase
MTSKKDEEAQKSKAERIFDESADVKRRFARENAARMERVAQKMAETLREGGKILLFGNGGSACDATHIAAEFVNRFVGDRKALAAISLTTDTAAITSIGNDYDYDQIFSRQIAALGKRGDLAIAISTSGNSPNVVNGVEEAKRGAIFTVAFTGGSGGKLASLADEAFVVPSKVTARIQESHITLGHVLCELVEDRLFGGSSS